MFLPVILCVCDVACSSGCGGKDWVRYEMFFFSFSILKVKRYLSSVLRVGSALVYSVFCLFCGFSKQVNLRWPCHF